MSSGPISNTSGEGLPSGPGREPGAAWLAWLVCLLAIAFNASGRIAGTLGDPHFDDQEVAGLLRSDPGLLYYITERILESDGGVPDDFHADPNVQHPDRVDLARMFTVGQEFLVAWAYRAFGGDMPLHVFCVVFFSILAALTTLGVFGAAYELTGRWRWAAVAAVFYVGIPVNFRTTGFILIREDLSIPLFAAHAWSLARLWRRPSPGLAVACGLLLAAALATWHAMGFIVALELAALGAWSVVSGNNPLARRPAWIVLGVVLLTSLFVPVLRAKLFLLSIPVILAATLALLQVAARLRPASSPRAGLAGGLRRAAGFAAIAAALLALASRVGHMLEGGGDYGHVLALLLAKVKHLGQLPADPTLLPFDVRLLWQGPFSTALPGDLAFGMPHALLAALFAFGCGFGLLRRGRLDAGFGVLLGFLALAIVSGLLVRRTLVVPGLAAPLAAVAAFARLGWERLGTWLLSVFGLAGMVLVALGLSRTPLADWYAPPERVQEIRALVTWIDENLPDEAALLGDFVVSTSALAHSRNPIALQPKYETAETRRRIQAFYETFAHGTPEDLRALAHELDCEYLLVDTQMLWWGGRYILGVPLSQQVPTPNTCAYFFANRNPAALTGVPGFELLYRSPPELRMDLFRVYRVR